MASSVSHIQTAEFYRIKGWINVQSQFLAFGKPKDIKSLKSDTKK